MESFTTNMTKSNLVACLDGNLYNKFDEIKLCTLCQATDGSTGYKELDTLLQVRSFAMIKANQRVPKRYILIFSSSSSSTSAIIDRPVEYGNWF
jgi:hypothetical protein